MFKDIITYQLAEGITKEKLLSVAEDIVNNWMKKLPGFISWEINQQEDGYTDIVTWESQEQAQMAEKEMANIPNAMEWYACYKPGSINTLRLTSLKKF